MKQTLILFLLFPIFYYAPFYFSYFQIISGIDYKENDKIVIFYDDFRNTHGELVVSVFTTETDNNYTILRVDNKAVRIEVLELVINDLIKQDKKVFLNISISPNDAIYSMIYTKILKRLSQYENMKIVVAAGNNDFTAGLIEKYTRKSLANEIDEEFYTAINLHSQEIKEIIKDENIDYLISSFGNTYGVIASKVYTIFTDDRDEKIFNLVEKTMRQILEKHGVKYEKEIVEIYAKNILIFSNTVLLQKEDSEVVIASSSSRLEGEDGFFLDCRIKNMVENKVRERAVEKTDKGVMIGTSISAPVLLSKYYNNS